MNRFADISRSSNDQAATAQPPAENAFYSQARKVVSSSMQNMPDHNMPSGFERKKITAVFDNDGKELLVGSFFGINGGKADFVTKTENPGYFEGGVNFEKIASDYRGAALIVAGPFRLSSSSGIEGFALQNGVQVGEGEPKISAESGANLKGMLFIENGIPKIRYLTDPDINERIADAKKFGYDVFQQTSVIRAGSSLQSSNQSEVELRFFVEGESNGKPFKGVVNFSEPMNYNQAVDVMKGLGVAKAICLDTGVMSEGYFYAKDGSKYLMIDEQFGSNRGQYTNVLVFFGESK